MIGQLSQRSSETCLRVLPESGRSQKSAFTLLELVVALGISMFLLAGLSSAVLMSLRANQMPDDIRSTLDASDVLSDIADEARYAIYITERSDRVLQFAVPDMNEDGLDDVIRYEWSGVAGDPLVRTFNFDSPVNIAENVQDFDLSYLFRTQEEQFTGLLESNEEILTEYIGDIAKLEQDIAFDQWLGQMFHPDEFVVTPLPADTVSWRVTRVALENRNSAPSNGQALVQLREVTGGRTPTSKVYEQILFDESAISGWTNSNYLFNSAPYLHPTQGTCLVVEWIGPDVPVVLRTDTAAEGLLKSTDQGATFSYDSSQTLRYRMYGKYRIPGGTQSVTRQFVTGVRSTLQLGETASTLNSSIPLINMPESLMRFWKLDFDIDPTTADVDFDDVPDWQIRNAGSFDTSQLNLGVWDADDSVLETRTSCDFDTLTTVIVRMRSTSIGGDGAVFEIEADHSGGDLVPLKVSLAIQPDNTQTLTAWKKTDDVTWVALDQVSGLSTDFIDIRMLIDPDSRTVAVSYDGAELGAYDYVTFSQSIPSLSARLYEDIGNAEFDFVSIRVSQP